MDTPQKISSSKAVLFVAIGLLIILIILVSFVLMRVYSAMPDVPVEREYDVDQQTHEPIKDTEKSEVSIENAVSLSQDVSNGILVEQSTRNGNWTVTVNFPETILADNAPSFSLQYPPESPWGLMRVEHVDATATDGPGADGILTPYTSFFTFRASNYYASGNDGMTFDISTAYKPIYLENLNTPGNVYQLNNDILIGEDNDWVYLYRYKNNDAEVRSEVDLLLKSFYRLI